ncbi:MAG: hypothetical protein H0V01_06305 [Bacteroidetes bacterium]|nr:hypothetical protein [Bacteroidota bacterium]HET6244291.1 hypothetical protein [Bacteroidia bacterium]
MPVFTIFDILSPEKRQFYTGFYLGLVYLDRIPPHLIFILEGKIYSITTKGNQAGTPVEVLLKTISQKQIQSLFFKINPKVLKMDQNSAKESMDRIMQKYSGIKDDITCLSPLKDFFSANLSADFNQASVVFHLISELYKHKCILNVYQLFMESRILDNNIELETYSIVDVRNRIKHLDQ